MTLSAPATLLTAIVTILAVLISVGSGLMVARARHKTHIMPPAMTGAPELERALRAQGNTLEQFVIFVPALWLAALYFQGWAPPALGLVWCLGRIIYIPAYIGGGDRRLGFRMTVFTTLILVILAIIGIVQARMVNS